MTSIVPSFFVYGEPDRPLDVGFVHVETVMARKSLHLGTVAAHKHDHLSQITYWTKGHGHYFYEDCNLDFSAPAISFMPSGVVHGFEVEPAQSDAIVVSIADDARLAIQGQTILPLDAPLMIVSAAADPLWDAVDAAMRRIDAEYHGGQPGMDKTIAALVGVVLTDMVRLSHKSPAPGGSTPLDRRFRALVDLHFRDSLPIEFYVEALGTTPHLLAKACRAAFGRPAKGFINERRLLEAKRLLLFTVRSIEDIAFEIGLKDPAYFSRYFKHHVGQAPSEWRTEHWKTGRIRGD